MEEENKPCPECGAYNGRHSPRCPLITFESAKEELERYYSLWLDRNKLQMEYQARYSGWVTKANLRAELWEGKYRIVKLENNTLRKKVTKQKEKEKLTENDVSEYYKDNEDEDTTDKIAKELAEWSLKYPRGVTYSSSRQPQMDGELIALEERAKKLFEDNKTKEER